MSHQRLGETARARVYYEWAVRWAKSQGSLSPAHHEALTALRVEAEELLGIDRKKD